MVSLIASQLMKKYLQKLKKVKQELHIYICGQPMSSIRKGARETPKIFETDKIFFAHTPKKFLFGEGRTPKNFLIEGRFFALTS